MTPADNRAGIWLMIAAVAAFTVQDGLTRYLAGEYSVWMAVMTRYWVFGLGVLAMGVMRPEGLRAAVMTDRPWLQMLRGALHCAEICVIVAAFTLIGLINTHAIFSICPLIVAALSGPLLGERVGLARWLAIGAGFVGVLVILQPGTGVFSPLAVLPLLAAGMFALYSLLTRLATRAGGSFAAFFWAAIWGGVLMTLVGIWSWEPMSAQDWGLTVVNGGIAILANWCLIRCYSRAEANVVQPFAYLQLLFVMIMGVVVFAEPLAWSTIIGGAIVVAAGLSTLFSLPQRAKA